jgi:hypothetical protein
MTTKFRIFISLIILLSSSLATVQAQQTCEAYIGNDVPNSRYTVHLDQTITDKLTGLMWAQCTVGRSGPNCAVGDDQEFNWSDALQAAADSSYADYSNWRLPNIDEYRSLVNYSCRSPSINLEIFPNVQPRNNFYWSAEIKVRGNNDGIALLFDFLDGIQNANFRTGSAKVMLVRKAMP